MTGVNTLDDPTVTGISEPNEGGGRRCAWSEQWCDEPVYGWLDMWRLDAHGDPYPLREYFCERHYAFTLLTTADALEADDRWKYARTDEERRNTAMRYIIGFGRVI